MRRPGDPCGGRGVRLCGRRGAAWGTEDRQRRETGAVGVTVQVTDVTIEPQEVRVVGIRTGHEGRPLDGRRKQSVRTVTDPRLKAVGVRGSKRGAK